MVEKIDKQDMIIEYIKKNGPVIPIEISKFIRADSLIASAMLSGLASMNQLKVSKMKIGGSPLYYLPGQEELLQRFSDKLGGEEKVVYNLLKSKKVLRNKRLNQAHRDALQKIRDFAVLLEVEIPGKNIKEVFWKWYLLNNEETENAIKEVLRRLYRPKKIIRPAEPLKEEQIPIPAKGRKERAKRKRIKKEVKRKILKKKELEKKTEEEKKGTKFKIEEELLKIQEEEKEVEKKEKPKPKTPAMIERERKIGVFMQVLRAFFNENDIDIVETSVIKPNEVDFTIRVPSAVGKILYYCKAKDKKTINEGDLSTAFVQGQLKKMPVLFLTKGKLTKRAKEMHEKQFQQMNVSYLSGE